MDIYKNRTLSIFGGEPYFKEPVPVGQLYFPEFSRYENALRDIFARRYYTSQREQAPLIKELEERLSKFLEVKNVICVANATIGLIMVAKAMRLSGKVVLPSWTFIATVQSLFWNRLEPVFCDINLKTQHMSISDLEYIISRDNISGILGVNLWGGAADVENIVNIANKNGIQVYFDSAQAFGCTIKCKPIGGFGRAEVFSFHATKILSSTEGGAITTNDDDLADKLKSMIYYTNSKSTKIEKTFTARMSEIQSAIALMSLDDFPKNRLNNEKQHAYYSQLLQDIPGISVINPQGVSLSNYQYLVLSVNESDFGLTRDDIWTVLRAENILARRYFHPAAHSVMPFSKYVENTEFKLTNTIEANKTTIQLPLGAMVTLNDIEIICHIIHLAHNKKENIRKVIRK